MAGTRVSHGTLVAATAAAAVLNGVYTQVEVLNRGTDFIYCSTTNPTPTVAGDDCDVVPPNSAILVYVAANAVYDQGNPLHAASPTTTTVYLVSASATPWSVTGEAMA